MGRKTNESSAGYEQSSGISRTFGLQRFSNILDRIAAGELDELGALGDAGFLSQIEEHLTAEHVSSSAVARAHARGQKAR